MKSLWCQTCELPLQLYIRTLSALPRLDFNWNLLAIEIRDLAYIQPSLGSCALKASGIKAMLIRGWEVVFLSETAYFPRNPIMLLSFVCLYLLPPESLQEASRVFIVSPIATHTFDSRAFQRFILHPLQPHTHSNTLEELYWAQLWDFTHKAWMWVSYFYFNMIVHTL